MLPPVTQHTENLNYYLTSDALCLLPTMLTTIMSLSSCVFPAVLIHQGLPMSVSFL